MKRFVLILMLISVLIIFGGCSNENAVPEGSSEVSDISAEIRTDGNGKYGLFLGEKVLVEPLYDSYESYENFVAFRINSDGTEKVRIFDYDGNQKGFDYNYIEEAPEYEYVYDFAGRVTEGTMLGIVYDENGEPELSEVPADLTYLLDAYGNPLAEVPFENFETFYETTLSSFSGVYDGSRYSYSEQEDGSFMLEEKLEPSEFDAGFGYTVTSRYFNWYGGYSQKGLKRGDEVILDPVYSGIDVVFEDRIVTWYGAYMQGLECGSCKIMDIDGNILCEKFNRVEFTAFDDGSYIGIGIAFGPNAEMVVYDENGEPMPAGFWFIDKDGNILSDLFPLEYIYNLHESDGNTMIFHPEDGEPFEIDISKYIRK